MGINGSSYTSEIAARKARNRRLERQERIEIEVENRALKQELTRLRRVEEQNAELQRTLNNIKLLAVKARNADSSIPYFDALGRLYAAIDKANNR